MAPAGNFLFPAISGNYLSLPLIKSLAQGMRKIYFPAISGLFLTLPLIESQAQDMRKIFTPRSFPPISAHIIPGTGLEDAEQNTGCMLVGITFCQAIWATERIPSLQTSQNISSIYNSNGRPAYPQQATVSKQPAAGTGGPVAQRGPVTYMRVGTTSIDELKDNGC